MSLERYTEALIRVFMAIDPYIRDENDYRLAADNSPDVPSALRRFTRFVEKDGPIFLDHRRFWNNGEANAYILRSFTDAYSDSFSTLCCIWKQVKAVIDSVCSEVNDSGQTGTWPPKEDLDWIRGEFETGHKKGSPVLRFLYDDPDWKSRSGERQKMREKRRHLDATFVMSQLLQINTHKLFGAYDLSKECCYLPNYITPEGTNKRLLDRQISGVVCLDFEERKDYLRGRLHVLTTLWDLSTAIRARTFSSLIGGEMEPAWKPSRQSEK